MNTALSRVGDSVSGRELWRPIAALAVAIVPGLVSLLLIHFSLDAGVREFVPNAWNDQVGYWHRILSFSQHGFNSGYYALDEKLPALSFNRFGVQGPLFPMVYGSLGAIFGWNLHSGIFFNMALLGLALGGFVWAAGLDRIQALLVGLLAASFGPILLYVPTISQEAVQQSIAVVLALLFSRLLLGARPLGRGWLTAGFLFLVFASFIRFSWALLLVPFVLLAFPPSSRREAAGRLAAGLALVALVLFVFNSVGPPNPDSIPDKLGSLPTSPGHTISVVASDAANNVQRLFDPDIVDVVFVLPGLLDAISLQAWEIAALIVLALLVATGVVRRLPGVVGGGDDRPARREWAFHAYNLGTVTIGAVLLYIPGGYYRVLGANLLLSLLVMIRSRRFAPVVAVLGLSVVMLPSFLNIYESWKQNFSLDPRDLSTEHAKMERVVRYQSDAPTPWCNTILTSLLLYDYRITQIPAGIGVSYLQTKTYLTIDQPLKSRYLLLSDADVRYAVPHLRPRPQKLATFSFGSVYENPAVHCRSH